MQFTRSQERRTFRLLGADLEAGRDGDGCAARAEVEPTGAGGPPPAVLLLEPRPRSPAAALSSPGAGDQGYGASARPLLGRGQSKARGSHTAPRLGGDRRAGGPQPTGPEHQPASARRPGVGGRPGSTGKGRRRRGTGWGPGRGTAQARARRGLRGRLGLAARAALRRETGPRAPAERTKPRLLPRGAASLARWLRVGAGRRAHPVARPESVESSLRATANPAAPFARPAPPPSWPPPPARPFPAPHGRRRLRRRRAGPAYIPPPRRRLLPRPLPRVPPGSGSRRRSTYRPVTKGPGSQCARVRLCAGAPGCGSCWLWGMMRLGHPSPKGFPEPKGPPFMQHYLQCAKERTVLGMS